MERNAYKRLKPPKRNFRQYNEKAGDRLVVSQMANTASLPYLQDLDTHMPEKVRHKDQFSQNETMSAVQPTTWSAKEKSPHKIDEIEMDTGKVEIGYEKARRQMHLAFVQNQRTEQERKVTKSSASFRRVDNSDKFYSGDETFYRGAIDLECDTKKTMPQVIRQLEDISRHTNEETTIDQVIPFQETRKEQKRINELRDLQHESQNRASIINGVTALETVKNKKIQRKKQFMANLREAITKTKFEQYADPDFLLYLRKKKDILDAIEKQLKLDELQEILEQYDAKEQQETVEDM